jgi:hypothetical protein
MKLELPPRLIRASRMTSQTQSKNPSLTPTGPSLRGAQRSPNGTTEIASSHPLLATRESGGVGHGSENVAARSSVTEQSVMPCGRHLGMKCVSDAAGIHLPPSERRFLGSARNDAAQSHFRRWVTPIYRSSGPAPIPCPTRRLEQIPASLTFPGHGRDNL